MSALARCLIRPLPRYGFFCLALFQVQGALYLRGFLFQYPALFFFHLTVLYLIGALLYFAFHAAGMPGEDLPGLKVVYFLPSAAALVFDCFYLVQPETNKILVLSSLFFGGFLVFGPVITALAAGAGIQATVLLGSLLVRISRRMKVSETDGNCPSTYASLARGSAVCSAT